MRVNGVEVTMPDGQAEALMAMGWMVPRICDRCGVGDTPENRVFLHRTPVPPEGERITLPLCDTCWKIRSQYAVSCE
jgi:hypothetical protein